MKKLYGKKMKCGFSIAAEVIAGTAIGIMIMILAGELVAVNVFANDDFGWHEENGEKYWYENGIKQGTDGRGKEIYDPLSDAWYWLDSVDGGKMAVSKDVYQESEAGDWGDKINEFGNRVGKWVRYDESGHMIKGWNTNDKGTYYFDLIYGTMAKGEAVIDGISYYFNMDTGILESNRQIDDDGRAFTENGWHKVNGIDYWYENGVRQGVKYNTDGSIDNSYRGKEIYDPDSNAWYWLDCVLEGAIAQNKDVYQESQADDYGSIGKWVRYDENGHMIKGWSEKDGNKYYFDMTYGTMMKGMHYIDDNDDAYVFDNDTGVLIGRWDDVVDQYYDGQYIVGKDIPAGYYVLLSDENDSGYFCVSTDANGKNIIFNDIFETNSIIQVFDGEYLQLNRCVAYHADDFYSCWVINTKKTGVMLYVGLDIEAGEYKLVQTSDYSGYYCIYGDCRHDEIIANKIFNGTAYVNIKEGQFLKLERCKLILE